MKEKKRNEITSAKGVVQLAGNLRRKLAQLGVDLSTTESLDRLPVDLADIYEVCVHYQCLIDKLLKLPAESSKEQAKELVEELNYHLYEHLPYHLKGLSKGLRMLAKELGIKRNSH